MSKLIVSKEIFTGNIKVRLIANDESILKEEIYENIKTIKIDDDIDAEANNIRSKNKELKSENDKLNTENKKLKTENKKIKTESKNLKTKANDLIKEKTKNEELEKQIEMQDAYITYLRDIIKELKNKLLCYN